jgi:uncharacterized protein YbjT (DUF2867 family)
MLQKLAVLGATGHVGTRLTRQLLAQGHAVTAIARPSARLDELQRAGATPHAGSLTDAAFLTQALCGVEAAFVLTPPNLTVPDGLAFDEQVGESVAQALRVNRVARVVHLSSLGAERGPDPAAGTGYIRSLSRQEARYNALAGVQVLHLRCGYFMENLLDDIPVIQQTGRLSSLLRPDLAVPFLATRDVANHAAALLTQGFPAGEPVQELVGPHAYLLSRVAAVLGAAIGRPDLQYAPVPAAEVELGLLRHGISPSMTQLLLGMLAGMNAERLLVHPAPGAHRAATTLEEFARDVFAPAYQAV